MDIVTHAMTAVIAAAPLAASRPLAAACMATGCVLPDLDVLARLLGKQAFLRFHQTVTHSLFVMLVLVASLLAVWRWADLPEPWAPLALGAGIFIHSLMDASNTYGAAILWPLVRKRFSFGWLFFIDAVTVVVTGGLCLVSLYNLWNLRPSATPAALYAAFVAGWWMTRFLLARRVRRSASAGPKCLVPSALWPWRFYSYSISGQRAELCRISAVTGLRSSEGECEILDELYNEQLSGIPEFNLMRRLSGGYHVVAARPTGQDLIITCRDLRTRNFGGQFGMLEVTLGPDGKVQRTMFHV